MEKTWGDTPSATLRDLMMTLESSVVALSIDSWELKQALSVRFSNFYTYSSRSDPIRVIQNGNRNILHVRERERERERESTFI